MAWSANPTDEQILAAVHSWIGMLATGDYNGAFAWTQHDPHYRWTPRLIEELIRGYGLSDPHPSGISYSVTSPESAAGGPPRCTVQRTDLPANAIAYVEHDLPLNGVWSDLTATFIVAKTDGGADLVLGEIHVL